MALDPKYIVINDLQQYFVDKTTGFPMAAGKVYFWQDDARTVAKPVYKLTGTPPNYSYAELANPLILSSVGTFIDETGTDITVYAYPYSVGGERELYFVEVFNSDDEAQFSREAFPGVSESGGTTGSGEQSFIPNGQFLLHNDIPNSGAISTGVTDIAPGGWTFERDATSSATDFVIFNRFNSYVSDPSFSPRYQLDASCLTPNLGDTFKSVRIKFGDVNKFSSDTQYYTLAFQGRSNLVGNLSINISIVKNYGTGGDPEEVVLKGSTILTGSFQWTVLPFIFGNNSGKIIGTAEDDYVQISIDFPADSGFDASMVNFVLLLGDVDVAAFPSKTNSQMSTEAMTPGIPNPDGSSYGLPIVSSKNGLIYDDTSVGRIEIFGVDQPVGRGLLLCDGASYDYSDYSAEGIPNSRLGIKLWDPTTGQYAYGQGFGYFSIIAEGTTGIRIHNTTPGASTSVSDGIIPTGFTFSIVSSGHATPDRYGYYSPVSTSNFYALTNLSISTFSASVGTSGFSVIDLRLGNSEYQLASFSAVSSSSLAGDYFIPASSSNYYWFKVNGSGSDPAPGGTGHLISLTTDTSDVVAQKCVEAINGFHTTLVTLVAGSAITPGSYFNIYTQDGTHYVPWYAVDGVGTAPSIPTAILIKIDVASTYTQQDVGLATILACNIRYFAVPDHRGLFLRCLGGSGHSEISGSILGMSQIPGITGDAIGTIQLDSNLSHGHSILTSASSRPFSTGSGPEYINIEGSNLTGKTGTRSIPSSSGVKSYIRQ